MIYFKNGKYSNDSIFLLSDILSHVPKGLMLSTSKHKSAFLPFKYENITDNLDMRMVKSCVHWNEKTLQDLKELISSLYLILMYIRRPKI